MTEQQIKDIENKKRSLKRYKKNKACINRLREKLDILINRIESAKTSNLSGLPRGGVPLTMDDLISEKDELIQRIERLNKKQAVYKSEILNEIDTLDDVRRAEVLESFFIGCLTLEQIAEKENYTVRHVYRLYSEGVTELALRCQ